MSKIEQIIAEIEEYLDNCKFQPLSNSKLIVNKDEIEDMLDDLKRNIPDEVKKYQRIISNRDAILNDAQDKAEEMIKKANEMTANLVSEHEIMQQAYREANTVIADANKQAGQIIDDATAQANELKAAANQYLDDSLADIQNILSDAINDYSARYEQLNDVLQQSLDITTQNRNSLHPQVQQPSSRAAESSMFTFDAEEVPGTDEDNNLEDVFDQVDLNFDEENEDSDSLDLM